MKGKEEGLRKEEERDKMNVEFKRVKKIKKKGKEKGREEEEKEKGKRKRRGREEKRKGKGLQEEIRENKIKKRTKVGR